MELDEEDSHLCIRCNQTIIGLQNYVNHRQRNCASSSTSTPNAKPSPKPFSSNFDFLNQAKKMENFGDFSFGDDEIGASNNKSTDSEQYNYDFFSSLELQSLNLKRDLPHPTGGKLFSHRILTRKATAAIMAQNGDEWIDESISKKSDSVYKYYNQNESESDEESEESEPELPQNYTRGKWKPGSRPPANFTGGKWKPESDMATKISTWDDNESSNEGQLDKSIEIDDSNPPPSHTKGKWVPGTKITKLEFKETKAERENFWCSFCSRSLATRPIYERHLKSSLHLKRTKQQNELEAAAETLPVRNLRELSTHFKELPDEAETSSEILDRATTSTPIVKGENDADVQAGAKSGKKKFRSRTKVTCEDCDMKLPVHLLGNHLISHFHYRKMLQNPKKSFDIVLNNFHKIIIQSPFQCHPCKFYFNTQDEFMRHWNSIAHIEHIDGVRGGKFLCSLCKFESVANADMTDHLNGAEHQQVVGLINRSKPIVIRLLSMLKCENCSQEFRYNIQLLKHLKTCEGGDKKARKFNFTRNSKCDECKKVFQSALSLQKHRAKVHKNSVFFCAECEVTFVSANAAKLHRRSAQHKTVVTRKRMVNDPQLKARLQKVCPICKQEQLDVLQLKHHILGAHPEHKFSCGRCGMKFPLAQEVSRHVRDKVCKFFSSNRTIQSSPPTSTVTSNEASSSKAFALITPDSIKFPASLEKVEESPTRVSGQGLDLIQILSPTSFVSGDGETEFVLAIGEEIANEEQVVEVDFACKVCDFRTGSHAELLFHETLHRLPINYDSKLKIECQVCKKFFSRESLRAHLRQHTNERIFECPLDGCPMSFTRKANLLNHVKNVHKTDSTPANVCRICGKKFQSKYILEQHKFIHRDRVAAKTFPCQLEDCIYMGRSSTDTRNHQLTHGDERLFICAQPNCDYRGQTMEQLRSHSRKHQETEFKFSCEHCDYKTKLSGHLKRHIRVHEREEGKIYQCPHCDYSCNNSENLRKHVLKTNKHPGKFLYECKLCGVEEMRFQGNSHKEFQSHLLLAHGVKKAPA